MTGADSYPRRFPLSEAQRALWFAQQLVPDVPLFIAQYVEIDGPLDIDLLRAANVRAAHEFESPFLRVVTVDGDPMQYLDLARDTSIELVDLRAAADPEAAAHAWMQREAATPIDLAVDRLVQTSILQVGDRHFLWYSRSHHIALDGYGAATMLYRIAHLYTAMAEGREPDPPAAADLRSLYDIDERYRASDRHDTDRAYWAQRLDGAHGVTLAGGGAPAVAESRLATAVLSDRTMRRLELTKEAHGSGASAAARIIAAFACYLSRTTGRRDVVVDIPVSARTTAVLRRSGGMTVNLVPVRIEIRDDDTVGDLVGRVQVELIAALRHQRCSRADIQRDLGVDLPAPIVNVMFFHPEIEMGSLATEFHIITSGPVDDLLVNVYQSGTPLRTFVDFRANPHRYTQEIEASHHRRFLEFLEHVVAADPQTPLAEVRLDAAPTARPGARAPTPVAQPESA
ncbi:condensation domain-containing protein, partial [Rhodococcus sp. (in: high G+C Gram-positive bacteria)]